MQEIESFPLHWPVGYKRTLSRYSSRFKVTMDTAQRFLRLELGRLGATDLIVSTNIPIRKDGMMYADWMSKKIDDPGVAIYFKYKGKQVSMCCDQYCKIWENVYALGKGIEALRGMERWGVSDFLDRAFTGFTALPEFANERTHWDILDMAETKNIELIKRQYRVRSFGAHPDHGGSPEKFSELNNAYKKALEYATR